MNLVRKASNRHGAEEFGQPSSRGIKGLDAPMIGAPTSITIDGLVERESGGTPPPPAVSVKALVITLVVMIVVGVALLFALSHPPSFEEQMAEIDEFGYSE